MVRMPRKKKFRRCSSAKNSATPPTPPNRTSNRSSKRKQWTNEQMLEAIEAVRSGTMSTYKAAETYGVPRSSLNDRIQGRVVHGTLPGPKPYLCEDEEKELSSYLISAADVGLGKTRSEVLRIAEGVASSKGILRKENISSGWWRSFLRRNKKLSLRAGDATASVRMNAITKKNMRRYFKLLGTVYKEFDFKKL